MNSQEIAGGLSEAEKALYHSRGYVIPDFTIPDAMLADMREALSVLASQNPTLSIDNMLCPHLEKAGVQGLRGDRRWLDFAAFPPLLNCVADLIGPDFLLWGTTIFGKPPYSGKETPMHQDGEYWPIKPLATCTAWIALDDATPENGCLRVVPGSHKRAALYRHHQNDSAELTLNQALDQDQYDEAALENIVLRAGQVSFHDVYLIHGSKPNRSPNRRAGFVCRYMPTSSHFDHDHGARLQKKSGIVDFADRRLFQMRGGDVCGLNDFTRGA